MKKVIIIALLALGLFSCKKELEIEDRGYTVSIVYISPDKNLDFSDYVLKSSMTVDSFKIKSAKEVTVYKDGHSLTLHSDFYILIEKNN